MVTFSTFVQEILLRWVVCNFPSVADILCAWKTHIENYLFKQKSCMFNPYELVVYLEKYLVAGATVPLQSNEYNRCRNTDESIAELSVLQCGSCKSVCLCSSHSHLLWQRGICKHLVFAKCLQWQFFHLTRCLFAGLLNTLHQPAHWCSGWV